MWSCHIVHCLTDLGPGTQQSSSKVKCRGIRHFMDRSRQAGIGQWHEYDHVACNNTQYTTVYDLWTRSCTLNVHVKWFFTILFIFCVQCTCSTCAGGPAWPWHDKCVIDCAALGNTVLNTLPRPPAHGTAAPFGPRRMSRIVVLYSTVVLVVVWYSSDTTSREIYDSDSGTLPKRPLVRCNQIQCLSTLSLGFTAHQSQKVSLSELPHLELSFVSLSQLSNLTVTLP